MIDKDKGWLDLNVEKLYKFCKSESTEDSPVRLFLRSGISFDLYEVLSIKHLRIDKDFVFKEDIGKINLEDYTFINKNLKERNKESFNIDEVVTLILWDLDKYVTFIVEKYGGRGRMEDEDECRGVNVFDSLLERIDDIENIEHRLTLVGFFLDDELITLLHSGSTSKRNQLKEKQQLLQNILNKENEAVKETKNPLLIEGKAPNILERYTIANELLDIDTTISKLNITAEGKSILLAQIMGCSKQAARELLNGTYNGRAKIRTSTIDNYISNLKK